MEPLNSKDPKSIGGFTLVGRLGKGGMGVVYLASRKSESVALKVIRDSLLDDESEATRFSREVSALEQISSANVARIVDAGVEGGRAWFAAEFVNGPNLSELVNDKGPLSEDQWWELARGLLKGLADVHKTGTIHRDIKPANLIIAETGPKLIDFGIAHVSDATSVTATGLVAGSPAWFSPEQIEGLELTPATDVFSAGSVLTFAASGSSPWGGETTMTKASVFKILTSEPDLTGLSPQQRFLLEKMLEKEPSERPTADSLIANLGDIRDGQQPELESSYVGAAKKISDATTVTKKTALSSTAQSSRQATPLSTQSGTSNIAVGATSSKKRNWLVIAAVSAVAILGVSLLVSNSSGSGKVSVSVTTAEGNPAVGEFGLRLSSGSIEPVALDLADKESHNSVFTWKSGEPIRVAYQPPFSEDEEFVGTIMPTELGLNGFSNGQHLFIQVSLERTSTLLSFRTGENRSGNEVYAIRLARGNETLAVEQCVGSETTRISGAMSRHIALWDSYEESLVATRLDGDRFLTHAQWASRFTSLISMTQANREGANASYSSVDPGLAGVSSVNEASIELEQALEGIATISRRFANSSGFPRDGWDDAWDVRWRAESRLESAVRSLSPASVAGQLCSESIQ
jgi:serine/threonine protein kinase